MIMSMFPDISPALTRFRGDIHDGLAQALGALPEDLAAEYKTNIEAIQDEPTHLKSGIQWTLYKYFRHAGFLQAIVLFNKKVVFSLGAGIMPWEAKGNRRLPEDLKFPSVFKAVHHTQRHRELVLEIEGVIPAAVESMVTGILEKEIMPFATSYFFNMPVLRDNRRINVLRDVEARCTSIVEERLDQGKPVTLTHFRFQDMHVYFEMSGEHVTFEIVEKILATIRGNLKKEDILLQLSPVSYLVLSPGALEKQIATRFESIYFQINSLVLDYDLNVATVEQGPVDMEAVWKELAVR